MTLEPTNPMLGALKATLIFEIVVVWLSLAGMLQIAQVSLAASLTGCGVVTLLALAAVAGLPRRWGFAVAWITQIALVAMGFLTPWMLAMGGIFAIIWAGSFFLGKRIETHRKASS